MGRLPRFISLCILFVSSNLAGCNGNTENNTLPPLTFEPVATVVVSGECDITPDLESWLQATEFRVEAFTTLIQNSEGKSPNQMRAEVIQVANVLQSVGQTPVIDCAEEFNNDIRQAMTDTLERFQGYINQERDDLNQIRTESSEQFTPIQERLNEFKSELDARLRGSNRG